MGAGAGLCPFRLKARAEETAEWLDDTLGSWLDAKDKDDAGEESWDWGDPANTLIRPRRSWSQYSMCSAFDWSHLPKAGGLDDQDDVFLHDAGIIARRMSQLRAVRKRNKQAREDADKRLRGRRWPSLKRQ